MPSYLIITDHFLYSSSIPQARMDCSFTPPGSARYFLALPSFTLCSVLISFQMNKPFMKTAYKPGLLVAISALVNAVYVKACYTTSLGLRQNIRFIFCSSLSPRNKIAEGINFSSLLITSTPLDLHDEQCTFS